MDGIQRKIQRLLASRQTRDVFMQALRPRVAELARVVDIPQEHGDQYVMQFVVSYIQATPTLVTQLQKAAQQRGLDHVVRPIVTLMRHCFRLTSPLLDHRASLAALLCQTYLVQRLLEEVNDRVNQRTGTPLLDHDASLANALVHHVLGEPFANELDEWVEHHVGRWHNLHSKGERWIERHTLRNLVRIWPQWPCLSRQLGLASTAGR
ncbi:MAG: hypothetical protein IBX52_11685 [Bacterioplanes sp.]|nr:hypothetical protein [Bacterioplanes sp.]